MPRIRPTLLAAILPALSALSAITLVLAAGCDKRPAADAPPNTPAAETSRNDTQNSGVKELSSPAAPGSMAPNLTVATDGAVYLNWLEPTDDGGHALRFAVLPIPETVPETIPRTVPGSGPDDLAWSPARTVIQAHDLFVNWADFPSMAVLGNGSMAAHWLRRSGPDSFDYDIEVVWSTDGGDSWGEPMTPHQDGTASEHGFVSLFPWDDERLGMLWLDGRDFAGWDEEAGRIVDALRPDDPEMSLRATVIGPEGPGDESLLDSRTCECCQTSVVQTAQGPVAFYRDRSENEIRDIASVRYRDATWTAPSVLHEDGWEVRGCPVNGPMAAAVADHIAVAWFTAPEGAARVHLAFSEDAGATFAAPWRVDDGHPIGRVAVAMDGKDAWVTWMEAVPGGADIRLRKISADGTATPSRVVAVSTAARASGFPRMVRSGKQLILAWTSPGATPRVMTAAFAIAAEGGNP